jgi:hypothetical protein
MHLFQHECGGNADRVPRHQEVGQPVDFAPYRKIVVVYISPEADLLTYL